MDWQTLTLSVILFIGFFSLYSNMSLPSATQASQLDDQDNYHTKINEYQHIVDEEVTEAPQMAVEEIDLVSQPITQDATTEVLRSELDTFELALMEVRRWFNGQSFPSADIDKLKLIAGNLGMKNAYRYKKADSLVKAIEKFVIDLDSV